MTMPYSQSDRLSPIRVLSVDDNAPLRASLRAIFALEEDIELVGEAADGREGVERAVALRPDVVMLDIEMPVMNGIEAARQIKQRLPDTKIVFFVAEVIWRTQAQAVGADAFLLKETPIATVVDTILRVAGRKLRTEPERLLAPEEVIPAAPPPVPAPAPGGAPVPAAPPPRGPVPPGLPLRPPPVRGVRRPRRLQPVPPTARAAPLAPLPSARPVAAPPQPREPGAPPPSFIPPPRHSLQVLAEAMNGSFPTPATGASGAEGRRELVALLQRIRTAADRLDLVGNELEVTAGPTGPGAALAGPLPAPADEIAARARQEVVRALMDLAQSLSVLGQEPATALLQTLQGRMAPPMAAPPAERAAAPFAPPSEPPLPVPPRVVAPVPEEWQPLSEPAPQPAPVTFVSPPSAAPAAGGLALPLARPVEPPTEWGYEPMQPPAPTVVPPLSAPAAVEVAEAPLPARAPEEAAFAGPVVATIQLSAYPFAAFSVLTKFMEALSQLADVREVRARRFHKGRLDANVEYASPVPLEERLKELSEFRPTVLRQGDDVIQFVLGI